MIALLRKLKLRLIVKTDIKTPKLRKDMQKMYLIVYIWQTIMQVKMKK